MPQPVDHVARRRPGAAVEGEVAALAAAAGPHVLRLLDLGGAPNGDVLLVVEHLPHDLPRLLSAAGWPTPGEAVTALAPIAQAVASLGAAGVVHGGVTAAAVRFDDDGRPVLAGFERAVVAGPADDPATDAAALRDLVCGVLRRAGAQGDELADRIVQERPAPARVAELLFGLAEPEPVRLHPVAAPPRWEPAGRLVAVQDVPAAGAGGSAGTATGRIVRSLSTVRPAVWVAAVGSVALLGAALVLLPAHTDRSAAETSAAPAPSAARARPTASPVAAAGPLEAIAELLRTRAACLARGDARCLAAVDAAASPVLADDVAAAHGGAVAARVHVAALRLVQASGTTALLTADGTTVLGVREPAGWRLRDVVPPR